MAEKRYVVRLNEDERTRLRGVVTANRVAAQKRARAQVLLKVDEGADGPAWTDGATAAAFDLHVNTVVCLRRRLVERGFEAALEPPPRVWRPRKLTPAVERELLAVAQSSPPPAGRAGPCTCWPTGWSHSRWSTRSARKRCGRA